MTEGWSYGGAPQRAAVDGLVTVVEGATFCISGRSGDIQPGAEQGLFYRDTRFISGWSLTVDGERIDPLTATMPAPYAGRFVGRRPPSRGLADSTVLVVRRRYVGHGMLEEIFVENVASEPTTVRLALEVQVDFAGLFEVKEGRAGSRPAGRCTAVGSGLRFDPTDDDGPRSVSVQPSEPVAMIDGRLCWELPLDGRARAQVSVLVVPTVDGSAAPIRYRPGHSVERSEPANRLASWRQRAPDVTSADSRVTRLLARSAEDLGVLRIFDSEHPDRAVIAAGAPWFMTLFGRDSLLTSWMLLPVDTSLALGTLQTLAELQGTRDDPRTEEQPGRILHEIRAGADARRALGGGNVYYGSVDATALFVMLLGELRRWGADREAVEQLLPNADRALEWIVRDGDRDGDGFVEYERSTESGLVNQGWKDSFDAISFADGRLASAPIALAEVQGYAYAAFLARAHFAREVGDEQTASEWAERAQKLKARFNDAFWLPDRGYYAIALDADKRPVDALASNMGHCLWTGIIDRARAGDVVRHLLGPEMFTGFGIRTLATTAAAYNPVSYHNGSVWPHDNAIIVAGMTRYGFVEEAQRVARGLLDAGHRFGGRLPELFCGFDRRDYDPPVPYPTSCSPQAWAAAAPLLLLRSLLRFDPWIPFGQVWCAPDVPRELLPLCVAGVHLAGAEVRLEVQVDGTWQLTGLPSTIDVVPTSRDPETDM